MSSCAASGRVLAEAAGADVDADADAATDANADADADADADCMFTCTLHATKSSFGIRKWWGDSSYGSYCMEERWINGRAGVHNLFTQTRNGVYI